MIDKTLRTCGEAVAGVFDGAVIMVGGFGDAGVPGRLLEALREYGAKDLVIVHNGAGRGDHFVSGLIKDGRVKRLIASMPRASAPFAERYLRGDVQLELIPQGTLVEKIRCAGAGLGGFYTPTAVGTDLAAGKETRVINGREHIFELPLHGDFAFIKAHRGDRFGNLSYRLAMRNFNPIMATAATTVIAEVDELVPVDSLPIEAIHTPGIFVDHVVQVERHPLLFQLHVEGDPQ
jgi:3-oxoadipate CoA-transferase alpha subunit